jgi:hypothetical protein
MSGKGTSKPTTSGRKMASKVSCFKCKTTTDIKNTLPCAVCKNYYEFDCAGVSEKLHRLKSVESRKKWKCKECLRSTDLSQIQKNVTLRKKQTLPKTIYTSSTKLAEKIKHSSNLNIDDLSTTPLNSTLNNQSANSQNSSLISENYTSDELVSPPTLLTSAFLSRSADRSIDKTSVLREMEETISQLSTALETTQNELDNATLENNELNRQINKLKLEKNTLQSLCYSATFDRKTYKDKQAKRGHSSMLPMGCSTPTAATPTDTTDTANVLYLQQKIMVLERQLKDATNEIAVLVKQIEILSQKLQNSPNTDSTLHIKNIQKSDRVTSPLLHTSQSHQAFTNCNTLKEITSINRLCVVSTISGKTGKKILPAILRSFDNVQCVHLATPGGRIRELLTNLPMKIQGYTKQDCCVLMIGEEDFMIREDIEPAILVQEIHSTLESLTHTNIIICTPTYICGAPLFNYRVELFNTYLNEALQNSISAHFYDSNLNLTFDMFSLQSGKLRPVGIQNILTNVKLVLRHIQSL